MRWFYLGLFYLGLFSKLETVLSAGSIVGSAELITTKIVPRHRRGLILTFFFLFLLLLQLAWDDGI